MGTDFWPTLYKFRASSLNWLRILLKGFLYNLPRFFIEFLYRVIVKLYVYCSNLIICSRVPLSIPLDVTGNHYLCFYEQHSLFSTLWNILYFEQFR